MKFLQRFLAIIITVLSIAIVFMVLASNEKTSGYVSFITDLFSENESDNIRLVTGNFEPIQGNGDQIEDSEVEALDDSGIDGSGYSFDTDFYPYFGMLSSREQALYAQIYANALALEQSFVPTQGVSVAEVVEVIEAVYGDHPELFYLDTSYGYVYLSEDNCVQITLRYNSLATDIDASKERFESAAEDIIKSAGSLSSDYDKEKYVHDTIAGMVTYDEGETLGQSAYSALVTGRSVCAGYSRAFQYIMTRLGIPTYFVSGTATNNHAWNMVKLDDEYYNVDLTWDDQDTGIIYNYFNVSDSSFSKSHTRMGLSLSLPECNGSKYAGLEKTSNVKPDDSDSTTTKPEIDEGTDDEIMREVPDRTEGDTFDMPAQEQTGEIRGGWPDEPPSANGSDMGPAGNMPDVMPPGMNPPGGDFIP